MGGFVRAEAGSVGRVVYGRVRPNEDLVEAVEAVCDEAGVLNGFVRGSLGSLSGTFDSDTAVSLLERGSVVDTVTSHSNNITISL